MSSHLVLSGRLALVTGSGSGIGRVVCQLFARNGASIVGVDRSQKANEETMASLPQEGQSDGQVHRAFAADVTDREAIQSIVTEVTSSFESPLSVLVNSAGIFTPGFLCDTTEKSFDDVVNINLKGTFLVTQVVSQAMVKSQVTEGSIINLSSLAGKMAPAGMLHYSATKGGIIAMTKSMANELARFNIRCNAVLPGFIATPMTAITPPEEVRRVESRIPLGHTGKPEHIAETCLFLASSRSSYITGASIEVTGGLGM
ncbi:estradiol 17-beta-dehydrogenase 8-like isoform X2 [Diadema setosum]|uniref:estradiol 17-beta-dehydrogenase 8-like isoform X2 n=1 Tax=Diadema setosum TaxID=31175 RepID=UPI003B3AEA2B